MISINFISGMPIFNIMNHCTNSLYTFVCWSVVGRGSILSIQVPTLGAPMNFINRFSSLGAAGGKRRKNLGYPSQRILKFLVQFDWLFIFIIYFLLFHLVMVTTHLRISNWNSYAQINIFLNNFNLILKT